MLLVKADNETGEDKKWLSIN